uniref:hypothetical protein n=1 Tax=Thaumasiovibrio occultus TaxID=1891184 RepID=UPI00131A9720|nr:hypothetical protein [Thaumasiovibrio occultus]
MTMLFIGSAIANSDNMDLSIQVISEQEYQQLLAQAPAVIEPELEVVVSLEQAQAMLGGRFIFREDTLWITYESGKELHHIDYQHEFQFVAYFPQEQLLLFDGYHDLILSLDTGESITDNPLNRQYNATGDWRMISYYNSQFIEYQIQRDVAGEWQETQTRFGSFIEPYNEIVEFHWLDDNRFIYTETVVTPEEAEPRRVLGTLQ